MDKNIILVIVLIIVLVGISIGILFWQFESRPLTNISPTTSPIETYTPTPIPDGPATLLEKEVNAIESADIDAQFKDVDSDMENL